MGGKSIARRAANERSRRKMMKVTMAKYHPMSLEKQFQHQDYPKCNTFDKECPPEIADPANPPEKCKNCMQFKLSKFYNKAEGEMKRAKELSELFAGMRKK